MPGNDLDLYERCAGDWWNPRSLFSGSLHAIKALRMAELAAAFPQGFRGVRIADLGCGGGLLSVPLARAGAQTVGLDLSRASLAAGRREAGAIAGLGFAQADCRRPPLAAGWADLVLCADLLEHVRDYPAVLVAARRLLRPGGRCYVSTMNRGWLARIAGVWLAEGLGLVPHGTHDHRLFIRPSELAAAARTAGFTTTRILGEGLRLWATLRSWQVHLAPGRSHAITYAAWLETGGTDAP